MYRNFNILPADLLQGAKEVGAKGIMFDLWWGLCEQKPNEYHFDGYIDLMQRCKALGLKVQVKFPETQTFAQCCRKVRCF